MTSSSTARIAALLDHAAELARLLLKSSQPPRELASVYLHRLKRLDANDRQFVSAAAHHALRVWRFSRACITGHAVDVDLRPSVDETRRIAAAALLLSVHGFLPPYGAGEGLHIADAELELACAAVLEREKAPETPVLMQRAAEWDVRARSGELAAIAVRWSLPDWVVRSWNEQASPLPPEVIAGIGRGLGTAAPLVLRVNRTRASREHVIAALREGGVVAADHPTLPDALMIAERTPLTESQWYEAGLFEVQDAGSQLVTLGCGADPGMDVLDACAGGGGKTMQLADIMGGSGSITACDIERQKLRGLEQRGRRLSFDCIRTQPLSPDGKDPDGGAAFPAGTEFDCVLVDAPCTGFGTVRRHTALKWRLTEKTVRRLAERQAAILARNAAYVRPGGILTYATCSLLPQENTENIRRFLAAHPAFSLDALSPHFEAAGVALPSLDRTAGDLLLAPEVLDSDGFYVARMRRDA